MEGFSDGNRGGFLEGVQGSFSGKLLGKHGRCLRTFSVKHVWKDFWKDSWDDSWREIREEFGRKIARICGRILGWRIRRKGRDDQVTPDGTITLGEEQSAPFRH